MATVNLTRYSSYTFEDVRGTNMADGSIGILMGTVSLRLSQEEWRKIRSDVENGTTSEDFRWTRPAPHTRR